jgi:hypothetical protein
MPIKTSPFVTVHDDGTIEIFGNPEGMPEITGVVPAPDVNTRSEKERQKRFKGACDQITLQGYYIKSKRLIRNKVFDDPGQKTTLKIVYRPCKNETEIRGVYSEFQKVLCGLLEERDAGYKLQSLIDNPDFLEIM